MGNPPFVGANNVSKFQKNELLELFGKDNKSGLLDYVTGWYIKAAEYINESMIKVALVSTNSIAQGEQVSILWKPLIERGIHIDFAYKTFKWDSEASLKAHVHCVIIGFSFFERSKNRIIFDNGVSKSVKNINGYLIEADNIFIDRRKKTICNVPQISKGCQPTDGGNLIIEHDEYEEFIRKEPKAIKYIKRLVGAKEFLHNIPRYCLWLVDISPNELRSMPLVMERVKKCKEMREASSDSATRKLALKPTVFRETYNLNNFIIIPSTTSENRKYIPMGFADGNVVSTNANLIIKDATLYHFGVLTSNVHMAWTKTVCGRLKSDYRYSKDIVYNNFPWCNPTAEQKEKIEKTAQAILDARAKYPDSSLADLYDELTMPPELRKAHQANDFAVMDAYGFDKKITESECVAELMKLYQGLVNGGK